MKISRVDLQGFRGVNEERSITLHPNLTLIYGPNSYGKTSISEAMEWLLYGITSRVASADSKDEYRGSYRNRHLDGDTNAWVQVAFLEGEEEHIYRAELLKDEAIRRQVDGENVTEWPFQADLMKSARPFVLQHTLKDLLLTAPDNRFKGFARLLGLDQLDQIQRDIVALCTKPHKPSRVEQLYTSVEELEARLQAQASLTRIHKAYRKGLQGLETTYQLIVEECKRRVPSDTDEESIVPQLLKLREEAVVRIFDGRITIEPVSPVERQRDTTDTDYFLACINETLIAKYVQLLELTTIQKVSERAQLVGLGVKFLEYSHKVCPLCNQQLSADVVLHIQREHANLREIGKRAESLRAQRLDVLKSLDQLSMRVTEHYQRHRVRTQRFLSLQGSMPQLKILFVPKYQVHFDKLGQLLPMFSAALIKLDDASQVVVTALNLLRASVNCGEEDGILMQRCSEALLQYVSEANALDRLIDENVDVAAEADQLLKYELDALAGTEDVSVLVDLVERRADIERKLKTAAIIDSLKDLRKVVDQFVAAKMLEAIAGELTADVMEWYDRIKTEGDPDVHFGGFDLDRTSTGSVKSRRVQIGAMSYGEPLASAVSSLSESKLNALGICINLAANVRSTHPFEFLIIDDPIQSWDSEHEAQFVGIIRELVDRGKQVILLSHNRGWIKQVRSGCRSINGYYYEIRNYSKAGPHIALVPWEKWTERLKQVEAVLKDQDADSVQLQQAEAEIRLVACDLASELYFRRKRVHKPASELNASKVRLMLIECGVKLSLVDKVSQTFATSDDAHHSPKDYIPNRQRIRSYCGWMRDLAKLLDDKIPEAVPDVKSQPTLADVALSPDTALFEVVAVNDQATRRSQ